MEQATGYAPRGLRRSCFGSVRPPRNSAVTAAHASAAIASGDQALLA
jgi:hypothetical protein